MVEYFDEYGNKYNENSTETNFEISKSKISGPAIKINRTFPQKVNATKEFIVLTTLENIGKTKAKVVLFDMNKTFNIDIKPGAKETIKNKITYTEKGEYILPAPELSYSFQKQILYSKGYADTIIVNSLIEPIKQEIKKTESKKEQTSNKSNNIKEDKKTIKSEEVKAPIQWIFLILTIIIIAIILIVFIFFKKGKRSTEQFIDG